MKLRVLIVDDEPLARERIRSLLKGDADVQIVGESPDGRRAVAAIRKHRPDLVLLDVQMPEVDGFGVLEAIDGTVAWSSNRNGVREMSGPEVDALKREYSLHREIRLKEFYPQMAVTARGKVGERDVFVVTASPAEKFYFDAQSGLLLRWDLTVREIALESYYEDYRDVDSVKVAFRIRRQRSDGFQWTDQF